MAAEKKGFDGEAFYKALEATVEARDMNWKQVSDETGVSASTLTRMAQGKGPDAASLAALSAWADLNPSDFVQASYKTRQPGCMTRVSSALRADPDLDERAAAAIEAIVKAAYERFKK